MADSKVLKTILDTVTKLDQKVSQLDQTVSQLDQKVTGLDQKVTGLDQKVTQLDGRMTNLEGRMTGLEGRMTNLEKGQTKLRDGMMRRFETTDSEIKASEHRLTVRLDKIGKSVAYLEDDAPTREEFDELSEEVEGIKAKIAGA